MQQDRYCVKINPNQYILSKKLFVLYYDDD